MMQYATNTTRTAAAAAASKTMSTAKLQRQMGRAPSFLASTTSPSIRRATASLTRYNAKVNPSILHIQSENRITDATTVFEFSSSSPSSLNSIRDELGRRAIQQVPKVGWTSTAVTSAILNHEANRGQQGPLQLTLSMTGMFPTPNDLVTWFMDDLNRQLQNRCNDEEQELNQPQNATRSRHQVYELFKWRLEQIIPLAESGRWHEAMAMGLTTPEITRSQLDEMIDIVIRSAKQQNNNDASSSSNNNKNIVDIVDSTYYRTALGAVFVATELHLLASAAESTTTTTTTTSDNRYIDTWTFLQQRLDELDDIARTGDINLTNLTSSMILPMMSSSIHTATVNASSLWNVVLGSSLSTERTSSGGNPSSTPKPDVLLKATSAVATSLFEGISSLVLPNSFLTNDNNNISRGSGNINGFYGSQSSSSSGDGTRPEDYEPLKSTTRR